VNQQQKEQWLAALRSGQYQQGSTWLHDKGKYCCLGVANELFKLNSSSGCHLLDRRDNHLFLDGDTQGLLAKMNDEGAPFTAIADYIEKNVQPTE
jgi:hypothetical protein